MSTPHIEHIDDEASTARLTGNARHAGPLSEAGRAIGAWLQRPGKAGRYGLILAGAKVFLGRHRPSPQAVAAGVGVAAVLGTALWVLSRPRR
jgi:hypothetical protein